MLGYIWIAPGKPGSPESHKLPNTMLSICLSNAK